MTEHAPACIYCRSRIPPALPSREHVLWDAFGGPLVLPAQAVCRDCNQAFSETIDREAYRFYRPLLVPLGVRGSKGTEPQTPVHRVQVNDRVEHVTMGPSFTAQVRSGHLVSRRELEDGVRELVFLVTSDEEAQRIERDVRRKHGDVRVFDAGTPPPLPTEIPVSVEGDHLLLVRGVAKTLLNFVAFRLGATVALDACFDAVRAFVRSGSGGIVLKEQSPTFDPDGVIDLDQLELRHRMDVSANGSCVEGTLTILGIFAMSVVLSSSWRGPPFRVVHDVHPVQRLAQQLDGG